MGGSDVRISRLLEGVVVICKPRRPDTESHCELLPLFEHLVLHAAAPLNVWRIASEDSSCLHSQVSFVADTNIRKRRDYPCLGLASDL